MNYSAIKYFCTVNGAGIFTSIFVSGCDLHCKNCFNQVAWDFTIGKELTDEVIDRILKSIEPKYIDGLSILGGEPLADNNCEGVNYLIDRFREKFGNNKKIWIWSGRYLTELNEFQMNIIKKCNYFVDGRFSSEHFDPNLNFRGSSNQTIWKIKENGEIVKSDLN